ncbi:MAG: TetR family transcriptional regulator [Actinomycetia bacterium]|nr:TetR family transcriptional regulator [Actinomycetes bacterium]
MTPSSAARMVGSGGRPRSLEREQEILRCALAALVDEGFNAMTMEGVASRAGAGKATLYRRWHNKAELVADAIRAHACTDVPTVDTGDVRADLRTFLRAMHGAFCGIDGPLMAVFTAERIRHPELGEAFERRFVADRRRYLRMIVRRGVERGQLPANTDVDLLAEVGPALMLHEFVTRRGRLRQDLPERILAQFLPQTQAQKN